MTQGGRGHHNEEPPPPPTMAQVLMAIEENRGRNERLLEQLVQQNARRNNECNTLTEFLRSQPPTFADAQDRLKEIGKGGMRPAHLFCESPHSTTL